MVESQLDKEWNQLIMRWFASERGGNKCSTKVSVLERALSSLLLALADVVQPL